MSVVTTMYIFFFSLYLLVFIFFAYTIYAMVKGAPFVPMAQKNVKKVLAMAALRPDETLMDLGSGDGRIVLAAAKTGARCIGIEINPLLYYFSKLRIGLKKAKNVTVVRQDLWQTELSDVDVLTIFFIAPKMGKLQAKIQKEMKAGARVVSYGFRFPDWQFQEKDDKVYLYIV